MTYTEAFLYGLVQGITEYLPVSSSAHLILLPRFLGTPEHGLATDVFLHIGTLAATLAYFWRDWMAIGSTVPGLGPSLRRWWVATPGGTVVSWKWVGVGTLPAVLAGAALHNLVETQLRGTDVLVWTLALGGIALWAVDHFAPRARDLGSLRGRDALVVGLFQCLALVPGMSRSGSTIMGGRMLGFDRAAAARFSFLLSAPITAGALVFEARKWEAALADPTRTGPLIVAALASFVFGWLAIDGLLRLVRRFGYLSFAIYRVGLAVLVWQVLG